MMKVSEEGRIVEERKNVNEERDNKSDRKQE
jgi:hypothetical protein